jgi:dipeptidyl-peptidase-4
MDPRSPTAQHVRLPHLLAPLFGLGLGLTVSCANVPESRREVAPAPPQPGLKRLTIDDLYDAEHKVDFSGRPASVSTWLDDEHWLQSKRDPKTKKTEWLTVEAATGKSTPMDVSHWRKAIAAIPGVTAKQAESLAQPDAERMSKDKQALLVEVAVEDPKSDTVKKDLWIVRDDSDTPVQVTTTPDVAEEEAAFSPDGAHVAFVAGNNLYVGDALHGGATALTTDGGEKVQNGKLDWLYQEEVYGRGTFRSFWWSPDSKTIAFLRLDEARVPIYTLVEDVAQPPRVERELYPRPGEPNPQVKLGLVPIEKPAVRFVDLSAYEKSDPLVVDVSWSPTGKLVYEVQDREQTMLDLRSADADGSNDALMIHETTKAWVDRTESPEWLADDSFLWFSERSGWKHIYRYRARAGGADLLNAVTSGEWEARALHGIDDKHGLVYFSGTKRSAIGSDVCVVGLDGRNLRVLSQEPGTHSASFSPGFVRYVDTWSDLWTPPRASLHAADGSLVRMVDENKVTTMAEYATSRPELLEVKARDGFAMDAMLIKPVDFDPTKRYPVMMFVYAGPHSQTVKNAWSRDGMFQQLLAERGVVVWSCDNRSASGHGAVSTWACYERFGQSELADIEDSLAYLKKEPWVDANRIGITGWSFGGFMTSYALTHSTSFALGVAGGSVTDWRDYDSIYTERFMKVPKDEKHGNKVERDARYESTSVVKAASNLHGKLVLVHGAIDDNVHPQNTTRLAFALQKANKDFDLMLYPQSRHGVTEPGLAKHWRTLLLRAIETYLLKMPEGART